MIKPFLFVQYHEKSINEMYISSPLCIVVGDTKWDRAIKFWDIDSHEWNCQPRAHVVTMIYIQTWTYDTWLTKYTPRLPDILGCFAFNVNFLIVDYFYLRIRYLMKITLFDDFDMWQNVDVQILIERI